MGFKGFWGCLRVSHTLILGRPLGYFRFPLLGLRGPYLPLFFTGFKGPTSICLKPPFEDFEEKGVRRRTKA